jgi:hypothetical protein
MDKQIWHMHTVNESRQWIHSGTKKNELSNHKKSWWNLKCELTNERGQSNDSMYLKFWKQNYGGSKRSIIIRDLGRGRENEKFWGTKTILFDSLIVLYIPV